MRCRMVSIPPCRSTFVGICLSLTFLLGCKPAHELETAPVRGTVTLDGNPLSGGGVIFVPEHGRGATGSIASDGSYSVGTYGKADGAIVGRHKVAVFPLGNASLSEEVVQPSTFPERYQNIVSSGLEVDIKSGEDNIRDLKLTTKQ